MPALLMILFFITTIARFICALLAVDNLVDVLHGDTTFPTVWATGFFAWLALAPLKFTYSKS